MKKSYLFGFALAAMTMVGCSNDEVVNDYSQDNAIQFGTYVGRGAQSRASVITTKELGEQGFGVFAYYHKGESTPGQFSETSKPDFMYNEKVTNSGNWDATNGFDADWTYAPVKYWPNNVNDRVSFFAYAPYVEGFELDENATGDPTIPYEVEVNEADKIAKSNGVDLLYLKEPKLNLQKQLIDEKVTFTFEHALSRIAFAAKVLVDEVNDDQTGDKNDATHTGTALADGTTITINSVMINGKFYTDGELNLNRPAPENNNELQTGWIADKFVASTDVISYKLTEDNFEDGANVFVGETVETEGLLNNDESYLMIMPQNFKESDEITITVDYNVVTEDEKLVSEKSDIHNIITSVPFTFNFEEGKAYKFTLHLGMTSVKLAASVTPWADGEDWSVNVPINNDKEGTGNPEWNNYYGNETPEGE